MRRSGEGDRQEPRGSQRAVAKSDGGSRSGEI